MQEQDEGVLQQQLQKEEQQKEKVSSDKARVDTLALNIKHWRSRAQEAHECFTCRRKLNDAEMVTFMQIQASPTPLLDASRELKATAVHSSMGVLCARECVLQGPLGLMKCLWLYVI